LARDANPFSSNDISPVTFDDAVRDIVVGIFIVALENDEIKNQQNEELLSFLREGLRGVDKRILEEAGVEDLTDDAITKLL
jgi:hypothetical protein